MELLGWVMVAFLTTMLLMFTDWLEEGDRRRNAIRTAWAALAVSVIGSACLVVYINAIVATV